MSRYYDYVGCPCPAIMKSETVCSYVNDAITVQYKMANWNIESLLQNHPGLELGNQQIYVYRPSDLFKKSVDSFVSDQSIGSDNLQCSYGLFDECNGVDGLADGCLNSFDKFACKFKDSKMLKDGLNKSDEYIPIHSYRMPSDHNDQVYHNQDGFFGRTFHVGNNPGVYCVNVTLFEKFDKPLIRFWDSTPLSDRYARLSLPNFEYITWMGLISACLIIVMVIHEYFDKFSGVATVFAAFICVSKNVIDVISIYFLAGEHFGWYVVCIGGFGTLWMLAWISAAISCFEDTNHSAQILEAFLKLKFLYYIQMCVQRYFRPDGFFAMGSLMYDLVIFKYNDQIFFFIKCCLNLIVWVISIRKLTEQSNYSKREANMLLFLVAIYLFTCFIIELSFVRKNSQFIDTFYKYPMVVIYSRLDEILLMVYFSIMIMWEMFAKHYQFLVTQIPPFAGARYRYRRINNF